jgi:VCBS repeat-containing protein
VTDTISNDNRNAPVLGLDAVVNSAIDYGGDVDVFRIEITEAGRYEWRLLGLFSGQGTLPWPYFRLSTETSFWSPTSISGGAMIQAELQPGVYFLSVQGGNLSSTGTYQLSSRQVNDPPSAANDELTGAVVDTPFVISPATLLANDTDRNARDVLSIYRVDANGVGGRAALVDGQIVFTPNPGYTGPASFTYWMTDGQGGFASARASFTVTAPPVPLPAADTAGGGENAVLIVDVLANDRGGPLTLTAAAAPEGKGSAAVLDGKLVFNPGTAFDHLAAGQSEVVTLTYQVRNATGALASSTVTVTLTGTNDAPRAVADAAIVGENGVLTLDVRANDIDPDTGAVLTVTGVSGPAGKGTASLAGGKLAFDPGAAFDHLAAGQSETVILSYTLRDEHGAESAATATVTVVGANDAPVAVADAASGSENGALLIDVLANDTDVDAGAVRTLVSAAAPDGKGSVSVVDGQLRFDPGAAFDSLPAGASETVTLTYEMQDEHGAQSSASVTLTITGVNDAPTARADAATGAENAVLVLDVLANDTDVDTGAVLSLVSASAPEGRGSVAVIDGKLRFDPGAAFDHLAAGASESVTLTYVMQDEHGAQSSATVLVTVTGINDAPVAAADAGTTAENAVLLLDVLANDRDADAGAVLTLVSAEAPAGKGAVSIVDGKLRFDPGAAFDRLAPGATEVVTLSYVVRDEHGATSTATVTLTVTGTNDAPVARADTAQAVEDASVSGDVLANDSDVDATAALTVSGVSFGGAAGVVGSPLAAPTARSCWGPTDAGPMPRTRTCWTRCGRHGADGGVHLHRRRRPGRLQHRDPGDRRPPGGRRAQPVGRQWRRRADGRPGRARGRGRHPVGRAWGRPAERGGGRGHPVGRERRRSAVRRRGPRHPLGRAGRRPPGRRLGRRRAVRRPGQ